MADGASEIFSHCALHSSFFARPRRATACIFDIKIVTLAGSPLSNSFSARLLTTLLERSAVVGRHHHHYLPSTVAHVTHAR